MTKQRGRFSYAFMAIIITLSMFIGGTTNSIYAAEGDIPATNEYLSDTNTIALDFNDTSTNGHTKFVKIWVQNNSVFVAVRSTHKLTTITLQGVSPLAMKEHTVLEHIKINNSGSLDPKTTLKGNTGDSRWTIATFPMSVVSTTGTYDVFVKGIGGGHDVEATYNVIIPTISVIVNKKWIDGAKPPIEVRLERRINQNDFVKVVQSGVVNPVTMSVGVDNSATYTWNNLDRTDAAGQIFEYRVVEDDPGQGYTSTLATTLSADGLVYTFLLTNQYTRSINDIIATKVWDGGIPVPIKINLYQKLEGGQYEIIDTVTVDGIVNENEDGTGELTPWKYTWKNMYFFNEAGVPYVYKVDEVVTPSNFTKTLELTTFTITNTYVSPLTSITAHKVWSGGPDVHPTVQLQLYRNDVAHGPVISLISGVTSYTWDDLAQTDHSGTDYKYHVEEINTPDNYTSTVSSDGLTITNTYTSPKTSITANKVWDGGPEVKPTIKLQLLRDGIAFRDVVTLTDGVLTYTWDDLNKTDINGNVYTYTVDEVDNPANYTEVISDDGLTVTNIYVSPKLNFTAYKTWVGGPETKPTVTFQLLRNNLPYLDPVLILAGSDTASWSNLDKTDPNGVDYIYTVDEINNPDNYTESVSLDGKTIINTYVSPKVNITASKVWDGGPMSKPDITFQLLRNNQPYGSTVTLESGTLLYTWNDLDKTDASGNEYTYTVDEVNNPINYTESVSSDGLTITNTYVSPKISITGNKVWIDGPSIHPTIELQLYRDNVVYGSPITLENGKTTHTWTDLDATDNDGVDYVYRIEEVLVPDHYGVSVSSDGLTITNTYGSPKLQLSAHKIWLGGPEIKPDITFQLLRDGLAFGPSIILTDGQLSHTWNDLDKTDSSGNTYVYTVDEINNPTNYTESVSEDGLTITNTYVSPKTSISAHKVWVDGPESKPDVTLQLLRDGIAFGDTVILTDGTLSHTWNDLDKTDSNANEYVYTVDEVDTPTNYVKSISEDGLTITNAYVSPKIGFTVTKQWVNGPHVRPDATFQLYRNEVLHLNALTVRSGGNDVTWFNLDKTDEHGVDYVYRVEEINVPANYTPTVSEDGLTIINTYASPMTEFTAHKVWVNGPEVKPEVTLQLLRDGVAHLDPVRLVSGNTSYTWSDLEETDLDGNEYVYSVTELNIPANYDYSISDDGRTITNTYVSPKTNVVAHKVWIGGPVEKPDITLQLLRDGLPYLDAVQLTNGTLEYEWIDLDETDLNGLAYTYSVLEISEVENYQSQIEEDGLTVTNIYVSPKSDVTAYKVWEDGPEMKPAITLQLLRDGIPHLDPITLINSNEYTWIGLDDNDSNGVPYVYSVDEINNPDNYIETHGEGGLVIINTYVSPLIDITTYKVWINGPEMKPSITIQLYRNNEPYLELITLENGELEYTWTNLDKTDSYGNVYEYTVGEVSIFDDYVASISEDGLTITNTYKSPLINITGNKVWVGGSSEHPTIQLQLYRNGVKHLDAVDLINGEMSYTWVDLDMNDENGITYKYTVDEVIVPVRYVKTISVDGLTITNTYKEPDIKIVEPPVPEKPIEHEKPTVRPPVVPPITGVQNQNVNTFILTSIIALFAIYLGIVLKKKNS